MFDPRCLFALLISGFALAASSSQASAQTDTLTLAATNPVVIARQNATPVTDPLTVTQSAGNTAKITLSHATLPAGIIASFTQPAPGVTPAVTFTAYASAPAGDYTVSINATDGTVTTSASITITVAVVFEVENAIDTYSGASGHLQQFMSTNVLPNPRSDSFFYFHPSTTSIAALNPLHIRIQPNAVVIPWMKNSTPAVSTDWNFLALDDTVQLMLEVGDKSPTFQIAQAPSFMNDVNGHFVMSNLPAFAAYAQNLVRYYNSGGFDYAGQHFQSASNQHITWWEIFNEPNIQDVSPANYVKMYDTLVAAMLQIDPTLKFVAVSLSDFTGQPQIFLPTLVQASGAGGGLSAQVDAVSTHFYGTCHQYATDASLFTGLTQFVADIDYFHKEFAKRSDLANVPVWVNEHNVNSEGCSTSTPDLRGTSTFFTAYRPLTFAMFGKAASKSLYHFVFEGNTSFGEVLSTNSKAPTTIAYWTDYWLQRTFPWDGVSAGSRIYRTTTSEATYAPEGLLPTTELLAVLNEDNSVSLMVTNYAVAHATDSGTTYPLGAGSPRTIYVDVSSLGTFSTATEVDLNMSTNPASGPSVKNLTPTGTLTLTIPGYGTSLFVLKP